MLEDAKGLKVKAEPPRQTFLDSKALFYLIVALAVVSILLSVAKVVIGTVFAHDCELQPLIPIWLIQDAFIPVFFCGFWPHLDEYSSESMKKKGSISIHLAIFLSLIWAICGGIWIYPNYGSRDDQCNQTLRSFAFAMITVDWSLMSLWSQLVLRLACREHARKKDVAVRCKLQNVLRSISVRARGKSWKTSVEIYTSDT